MIPHVRLKVMYSVRELAELCGENRFKMHRMLKNLGLLTQAGPKKRCVVLMSNIRSKAPELWASILDKKMLDQLL